MIFKWSSKDEGLSRTKPKCFCEIISHTLFNHDLNSGCLVNSLFFFLRFSGSKFLINLRRQFHLRKIFSCTLNFSYTSFCGICSLFILCLKLLFRKCTAYVLGYSSIKTCSLTGVNKRFCSNTISLSRHEQVCIMRHYTYLYIHTLYTLVHDVINLLYYEH